MFAKVGTAVCTAVSWGEVVGAFAGVGATAVKVGAGVGIVTGLLSTIV